LIIWIISLTKGCHFIYPDTNMSPDSIISFLRHDLEWVLAIIIVLLAIIIYLIITIKDYYKLRIIKRIKDGIIPSNEIVWKVKSIEYVLGRRRNNFLRFPRRHNGKIVNRFFLVEGTNPSTGKPYIYSSEKYPYDWENSEWTLWITDKDKEKFEHYVSQYIKIGDPIKIFVNAHNSNYYYLQDVVKN